MSILFNHFTSIVLGFVSFQYELGMAPEYVDLFSEKVKATQSSYGNFDSLTCLVENVVLKCP